MQLKIVNTALANGMAGEFATSQPPRTRGFFLSSYDDQNNSIEFLNVIGNVVWHNKKDDRIVGHYNKADGTKTDDSGDIAGILAFPKTVWRNGLQPTDHVTNDQQIEVVQEGYMYVNLWKFGNKPFDGNNDFSANIGDFVYVEIATGKLTACAPDTKIASNFKTKFTRLYGATVAISNIATPSDDKSNIAIIYLDMSGDRTNVTA